MTVPFGNHSFSKLVKGEACRYALKLQYIDRLPQKQLPPDNPLERGNREHKRYQDYVEGKRPDLKDAEARNVQPFLEHFEHARELYAAGMASTEQDWLFDTDWNVCDRSRVWLWSKLDLNVEDRDNKLSVVVDYKTGRSEYKTIEHVQQTQLYAATVAVRQEWAETIVTELWYVDEGHAKPYVYTRDQALAFVGRFDARFRTLENEKLWRPNPTKQTCRYCPYGPQNGTGACHAGV